MNKTEQKARLAKTLREARGRKQWTQTEAAEAVGVPVTTYKAWERKVSFPQAKFRERLSQTFDLDSLGQLESDPLDGFEARLERTLEGVRSDLDVLMKLVSPDGYDADRLRRAVQVLDAIDDPTSQPKH